MNNTKRDKMVIGTGTGFERIRRITGYRVRFYLDVTA